MSRDPLTLQWSCGAGLDKVLVMRKSAQQQAWEEASAKHAAAFLPPEPKPQVRLRTFKPQVGRHPLSCSPTIAWLAGAKLQLGPMHLLMR